MKAVIICILFLIAILSCKKDLNDNCLNEVSMRIEYTVVPGTSVSNSSFKVRLGVTGDNLCYKLKRTDVLPKPNNVFEVRPIGTFPCKPGACADALYHAADTVTIATTIPGTYRVDFYSNNSLISSNTVHVN